MYFSLSHINNLANGFQSSFEILEVRHELGNFIT